METQMTSAKTQSGAGGICYVYRLLRQGNCPALVPCNFYLSPDGVALLSDSSGMACLADIISGSAASSPSPGLFPRGLFEDYRLFVRLLIKTLQAAMDLELYMVPPGWLCFDIQRIYYSWESDRVLMLPRSGLEPSEVYPSPDDNRHALVEGICSLIRSADIFCPDLGAEAIAGRLEAENKKACLSGRRILSMLIKLEYELS